MRPRVLLDVDTVLADFLTPCVTTINNLMNTDFTLKDMAEWDVFRSLNVPKEVEELVYEHMNRPGTCLSLPVLPGAREGVEMLREIADIYAVTSPMRGATWMSERTKWLWNNFKLPAKNVIHASAKYTVAGDALIDDRPANLERWKYSHPSGLAILWLCEPNLHYADTNSDFLHTNSWQMAVSAIQKHSPNRTWRP